MQCETDLLRGDFTEAEIGCHLARDAALARGQYSILLTAEFTALRLAQLRGGATDAALERLRQTLKENRQFLLLRTLDLCIAWLDAQRGRAGADAWFMAPEADASFLDPVLPMLRTVQNEVLLAAGAYTKLLARREACTALNASAHTALAQLYLHIQLACAENRLGRADAARPGAGRGAGPRRAGRTLSAVCRARRSPRSTSAGGIRRERGCAGRSAPHGEAWPWRTQPA